jgi:hypothetical protein
MPDPRITNAKSLKELQKALQDIGAERLENEEWDDDAYDEFDLPTFGGEPLPREDGAYSWDEKNVLAGDTPTDAGIIDRETYIKGMGYVDEDEDEDETDA